VIIKLATARASWTRLTAKVCSGVNASNRRKSHVAALVLALAAAWCSAPGTARAQDVDQNLTLSALESELIDSPALAAADTRIFGADQTVNYESARGRGFDYFFENDFGPRSDIVLGDETNRTIRYGQLFGVAFPLFGTRLTEHLALAQAQSEANLARIEAEGERRKLLASLREDYIKYWQYDREQAIVANYVALEKAELPSARAFLREGFWTQANYLSFLDQLAQFSTNLSALRSSRRSALADIRAIVNDDVPDRTPDTPDLAISCSPPVDSAVAVAADNDADVARLQEQQSEAKASLDFIRNSSITADFRVGVGGNADIPQHALGYNITGAFAISFPQHMNPQESAKRETAFANIQMYHYLEMQRRSEIRASVMNVVDQASSARDDYLQAKLEDKTDHELLREARVREATIIATGAASFNEVQLRILDSYTAERKETSELGATYVSVNAIETLVPNTCIPFRIDGPLVKP
jgi:hypothetical protein